MRVSRTCVPSCSRIVMPPSGTSATAASLTFAISFSRLPAGSGPLGQVFLVQPVEVVNAALAPHRVAPPVVGPRLEPLLDRFADRGVLPLDLVGELDRLPDRLPHAWRIQIAEEPLEHGERPVGRQ